MCERDRKKKILCISDELANAQNNFSNVHKAIQNEAVWKFSIKREFAWEIYCVFLLKAKRAINFIMELKLSGSALFPLFLSKLVFTFYIKSGFGRASFTHDK